MAYVRGRLKNEMFYNHNWTHVTIDEFIDAIDNYMLWYSTLQNVLKFH